MKKLKCEQAKEIDLVDYLASLGHQPKKISNQDYWYLSPLRDEKTASFKVNRQKNVWYDHAPGKGGDLIDFGTLYHNCSVSDLLYRLSEYQSHPILSFHPPVISGIVPGANSNAGEKKETTDSKIVLVETRPLSAPHLIRYLEKRCIPLEIAHKYCREIDFLLYSKLHTVIGFGNKSGGYELRSENFKGSSSPKDISLIDNKTGNLAVFEGFFSFLSFATINKSKTTPLTNCLILNSLSFFEKSRPLMEKYGHVHFLLDRDNAGTKYTRQAIEWNREKFIDRSDFYQGRKDLNEWLIHNNESLQLKPTLKHNRFF